MEKHSINVEGRERPIKRRRRRCGIKSETFRNTHRRLIDLVDDADSLNLSENNYPPRDNTAELAIRNSLPSMLYQRQYGFMSQQRHAQVVGGWQRRALCVQKSETDNDDVDKHSGESKKASWRSYAARQISFLDLGTPFTEALLALDPTGSFMLTMADEQAEEAQYQQTNNHPNPDDAPTAYLCIRGVPSPAILRKATLPAAGSNSNNNNHNHLSHLQHQQQQQHHAPTIISPRLLTIPLDFAREGVKGRLSKRKVIFSLSQDWRLGLCLYPATNKLRDTAAHVTVFPLCRTIRSSDTVIRFFKTAQTVSSSAITGSMEGYNLLWQVEYIPGNNNKIDAGKNESTKHCFIKRQCGCLFVLRMVSDLSLTWFTESDAACTILESPEANSTNEKGGEEEEASSHGNKLFSVGGPSVWSNAHSSRLDGTLLDAPPKEIMFSPQIEIAHESVLHLDVLVENILKDHSKLAKRYETTGSSHRLEWKSEVIDVIHDGRVLNVLFAFSPGKAKHPVAVIVSLNLLSQTYSEQSWIKTTTSFAHIDMRTLCAKFRMKLLQCGLFESSGRPDQDGSVFDADECTPGLHFTNKNQEYCFMPLSALYTDSQIVSNLNILCAVPRMSLKSRSPVELVYFG